MQKLRAASKSAETLQPDEILESLLVDSGAAGVLPTSEKKLLNFLGLEQLSFDFMQELDFLRSPEPPPGELRAVLHLAERVIATHSGLGEKRTRFSIFHEIGHCVLPEHVSKLFLDTDQTLSWWTKTRLEREANQFAADILFQGKLFSEQTLALDTSLKTVIEIAPMFGASFEAAFRRYTESHIVPCGLIVFDKVSHGDESFVEEDEYRIHYTVTSPAFRKLFFSGVQLTGETCKASEIYNPSSSLTLGQVVERELVIESRGHGKEKHRFETEIFSNGYKIFQFLRRPLASKTSKN